MSGSCPPGRDPVVVDISCCGCQDNRKHPGCEPGWLTRLYEECTTALYAIRSSPDRVPCHTNCSWDMKSQVSVTKADTDTFKVQ